VRPSKRVRRPSNFRQQDVARAVAACQSCGLDIGRVDVDPRTSKISVVMKDSLVETEVAAENPYDTAPVVDPALRTRKAK
jgi:hypothetical protein